MLTHKHQQSFAPLRVPHPVVVIDMCFYHMLNTVYVHVTVFELKINLVFPYFGTYAVSDFMMIVVPDRDTQPFVLAKAEVFHETILKQMMYLKANIFTPRLRGSTIFKVTVGYCANIPYSHGESLMFRATASPHSGKEISAMGKIIGGLFGGILHLFGSLLSGIFGGLFGTVGRIVAPVVLVLGIAWIVMNPGVLQGLTRMFSGGAL